MRVRLLLVVCLLASLAAVTSVEAQVTPTTKFAFDQPSPDVANPTTALATVRTYLFRRYSDNASIGLILIGVSCTAGPLAPASFLCSVALPAYTQGRHTVAVTASTSDPATESLFSNILTFNISVAAPTSLRLSASLDLFEDQPAFRLAPAAE